MHISLKSKRVQAAIVIIIAAALVLSGAFAWYSFSQERTNTFRIIVAPGVNLHDDFAGGPEKDVYVENSGDFPVLVRVKLTELLIREGIILPDGAIDDDEGTDWHVHAPLEGDCEVCDFAAHEYLKWTMYGHKFFMPAPESAWGNDEMEPLCVGDLDAIIDYAALLRDAFDGDTAVLAYIDEYLSGDASHTAELQEAISKLPGSLTITDVRQYNTQPEEEFTRKLNEVRLTLIPTQIVTMESWLETKESGDFWVIDTDGWCYWASALQPQTATGQLLSSVEYENRYDGNELIYRINVTLNATTFTDTAELEEFFGLAAENGGISDDGKLLMQTVSGVYDARYFYHIGNGVYIEVADKNGTASYTDLTDFTGAATTYFFSDTIFDDNLYEINSLNGVTLDENIEAAFVLTLQIGEFFGYYDAPNTGYSTIYKGDEMREHQQPGSPNKISRTFTMKPIYVHTDGKLYIETIYKSGETGWQDDQENGNFNDDFHAFIGGMGADGEFGVGFFGVMLMLENGNMAAPKITPPQGAGTQESPYAIESRAQMDWVTSEVANGNTFEGKYLKVVGNDTDDGGINMGNEYFTPIGAYTADGEKKFRGHFDGNGKTIKNLKVVGSYNNRGLFGYIGTGGMVENIMLENINITGREAVGGVAGFNEGTINNCVVSSGTITASYRHAAGIAGRLWNQEYQGELYKGTVTNCVNYATIICNGDETNTEPTAGGIVGHAQGGVIINSTNYGTVTGKNNSVGGIIGRMYSAGEITNCHNYGTVAGVSYVGGIIGYANNGAIYITDCTNSAAVTGTSYYTGGIAGYTCGNISGCDNTGTVSGLNRTGGIAGYNRGIEGYEYAGIVADCTNTAKVSGSGYVGGIVGSNDMYSSVINCKNLVTDPENHTVTGNGSVGGITGYIIKGTIENCVNNAAVYSSADYLGGIVGRLYIGSADGGSSVTGCENTGDVTGQASGTGGIVGSLSYNSGPGSHIVTGCKNSGDVTGNNYTGGIVGHTNANANLTVSIIDCENSGDIEGKGTYTGGVVGFGANVSLSGCENSGSVTGNNYTGGVAGIFYSLSSETVMVSDCHNTGNVYGNTYTGGIAARNGDTNGSFPGTISGCTNVGNINGYTYAGGVAGSTGKGGEGKIIYCMSSGGVSGRDNYTGGIAGYNGGTVKDCYAWGNIHGDGIYVGGVTGYTYTGALRNSYHARGTVTGASSIGGVTGAKTVEVPVENCVSVAVNSVSGSSGNTPVNCYSSSQAGNTMAWWTGTVGFDPAVWEWDNYYNLPVLSGITEVGTETSPYLVSTKEELANLRDQVNSVSNFTVGKFFRQTADIDLGGSSAPWTPIGGGNYEYRFKGVYDGNGHTISGLYIDNSSDYQGLFTILKGGIVKNLAVSGNVNAKNEVGGIVGRIEDAGAITNCSFTGTVSGADSVGGIVGLIFHNASSVTLCTNTGTVSGTKSVGGIVGFINQSGTVDSCTNNGSVTGTSFIGAIVGQNYGGGTVTNNTNNYQGLPNFGTP